MKPKVLFPAAEAGMGHIMPMRAIYETFEKKYGDRVEVIYSDFFKETGDDALIRFEKRMAHEVVKYIRFPLYGYLTVAAMALLGTKLISFGVLRAYMPRTFPAAVRHMEEINPDLVFSTHWATAYYANHMKEKPLTVTYCPDAVINTLFRLPADMTLVSTPIGYETARRHKRRYHGDDLRLVPFLIRNEAFRVPRDKKQNRRNLGFPEDKFTVVLAEGGYGIGKMKAICELLVKSDLKVTVVPICGKNEKLYEYFKTLPVNPNVTFIPFGFCDRMLEVIASADLFCGKSGNTMAEACFFGVPQIATKFSTQMEADIARHYLKTVGSMIKEFNPQKTVDLIRSFVENPELLRPYREAAERYHENFGAEKAADVIWEVLLRRFPELADKKTSEPTA